MTRVSRFGVLAIVVVHLKVDRSSLRSRHTSRTNITSSGKHRYALDSLSEQSAGNRCRPGIENPMNVFSSGPPSASSGAGGDPDEARDFFFSHSSAANNRDSRAIRFYGKRPSYTALPLKL